MVLVDVEEGMDVVAKEDGDQHAGHYVLCGGQGGEGEEVQATVTNQAGRRGKDCV
jgi:hypothetical protein